jgi:hypothetical protein
MAEVRRVRIDQVNLAGVPRQQQRQIIAAIKIAVSETAQAYNTLRPHNLSAEMGAAITAAISPKRRGNRP